MKLLTVSSFSTSSSDCLTTHQRGSSSSRLTSRGLQLKKTLIDASTIECNEIASTNDVVSSRRQALHSMMGFSAGLAFVSGNAKVSTALDMDAFMNSQVSICAAYKYFYFIPTNMNHGILTHCCFYFGYSSTPIPRIVIRKWTVNASQNCHPMRRCVSMDKVEMREVKHAAVSKKREVNSRRPQVQR